VAKKRQSLKKSCEDLVLITADDRNEELMMELICPRAVRYIQKPIRLGSLRTYSNA
jgi:hypothetical protein